MLDKVLTLLAAVAELLRRWRRLREQTQHEQESHDIQAKPGQWLDEHFNGSDRGGNADRLQQPSSMPGNAGKASQTTTAKPHDNA